MGCPGLGVPRGGLSKSRLGGGRPWVGLGCRAQGSRRHRRLKSADMWGTEGAGVLRGSRPLLLSPVCWDGHRYRSPSPRMTRRLGSAQASSSPLLLPAGNSPTPTREALQLLSSSPVRLQGVCAASDKGPEAILCSQKCFRPQQRPTQPQHLTLFEKAPDPPPPPSLRSGLRQCGTPSQADRHTHSGHREGTCPRQNRMSALPRPQS